MPGLFTITQRVSGEILTAAKYNADRQEIVDNLEPDTLDDYSTTVAQMQSTVDPGEVGTESLATNLAGELERLRNMLKELGGGAQWYVSPALSAAQINTALQGITGKSTGTAAPDATMEMLTWGVIG